MKKKCTLVLISVLTVACIVFAYLLFFYNPSFNMFTIPTQIHILTTVTCPIITERLQRQITEKLRLRLMIQKTIQP